MKKKNYRSIPVLIDTSRPINQKKLDYLRSPSNIDSEEEEEYAKVRGEARDFQDFSSEPAYRGHYSGEECLRRGFMIAPRERPSPRRHIRALSCTSRRQKLVTRIYIYISAESLHRNRADFLRSIVARLPLVNTLRVYSRTRAIGLGICR